MGFHEACTAITNALASNPALSDVTVVPNPVSQITAELTLMVHPYEPSWVVATTDAYWGRGDIRVALHKKASSTVQGGIAADIAVLRPYVDAIPRALLSAWHADAFGETVANIGGQDAPWLRMERPSQDQVNGLDTVSLRFALNVTLKEEAI